MKQPQHTEGPTDVYALTDLSRTNVQALVEDPAVEDVPVLRPVSGTTIADFAIKTEDGFVIVHPRAVRLATGSDLSNWKTQIQMRDQLRRLGVTETLVALGIESGDEVAIGEWKFTWE